MNAAQGSQHRQLAYEVVEVTVRSRSGMLHEVPAGILYLPRMDLCKDRFLSNVDVEMIAEIPCVVTSWCLLDPGTTSSQGAFLLPSSSRTDDQSQNLLVVR